MTKQRNLRAKLSFADDEEEAPVIVRPSKDKAKRDKDKAKKPSLLSFGADEEEAGGAGEQRRAPARRSKFHRADASSQVAQAGGYTQRPSAGARRGPRRRRGQGRR
jgi:hypothetical protein